MSLMRKMLFSIVALVVFPTLLMPLITMKRYESILEKNVVAASQAKLVQIKKNLETVINAMVAASNVLVLDTELTNVLAAPNPPDYYDYYLQKQYKVEQKISGVLNASLYPYDAAITIIDFRGNVYDSHSNVAPPSYRLVSAQQWFKKTVALNGFVLWIAPTAGTIDLGGIDPGLIGLSREIKPRTGTASYGVLLLTIQEDPSIAALFGGAGSGQPGRVLLLNQQNTLIAGAPLRQPGELNSTEVATAIRDGNAASGSRTVQTAAGKFVVNFATIEKTGWKIAEIIPFNQLTAEITTLRQRTLIINALFLLGLLAASFFISWGISRPVHRLAGAMHDLSRGNFDARVAIPGSGEIAQLSQSFNQMAGEIDALVGDVERESALRVESRLQALQAQVNPHFLFNTLNGIKWMASMGRVSEIPEMISSLGNLLETALDNSREMIPLRDELQCVRDYVKIQHMRFGTALTLSIDAGDDALDVRVPCLILQPLVENSIIHGGAAEIEIRASVSSRGDGRTVGIDVIDNGKGMAPDSFDTLLRNGAGTPPDGHRFKHIGLRNVQERIRLHFGIGCGIELDRDRRSGCRIRIVIPLGPGQSDHA